VLSTGPDGYLGRGRRRGGEMPLKGARRKMTYRALNFLKRAIPARKQEKGIIISA